MILALDTSIGLSIAVMPETVKSIAQVEYFKTETMDRQKSENLATELLALLDEANLNVTQISKVVIGTGPGFFTSLRIGFAFGQMLAFPRELETIAISSHQAAAFSIANQSDILNLKIVTDAKRNQVFMSEFVIEEIDNFRYPRLIKPAISCSEVAGDNVFKVSEISASALGLLALNFKTSHQKFEPNYVREPDVFIKGT